MMMNKSFWSLFFVICVFVSRSNGILVEPGVQNVQEFIRSELNKPQGVPYSVPSGIQFSQGFSGAQGGGAPLSQIISSFSSSMGNSDGSGKPEKISVTIFKEFKVQQPDGTNGYVSIQEQGGDFKGRLNPPQINSFIQEHTQNYNSETQSQEERPVQIQKADSSVFDQDAYQIQAVPGISAQLPQSQPQQPRFQIPSPSQEQIQQAFELYEQPHLESHQPMQQQYVNQPHPQTFQQPGASSPSFRFPVPATYKRKTMDGWIPLFGKSLQSGYLSRGSVASAYKKDASLSKSHYVKGKYTASRDVQQLNSIEGAASNVQPQVVPLNTVPIIQQGQQQLLQPQLHTFVPQGTIPIVQPHLQYFTQNEVISAVNQGQLQLQANVAAAAPASAQEQVVHTQVKNLVINKPSELGGQLRAPVYSGPSVGMFPPKVVIHAQNVIINSDKNHTHSSHTQGSQGPVQGQQQQQAPRSPNVSQIKAYDHAPQITALLREQFRLSNKQPFGRQLTGKASFPQGGLPLRTLAQAIRNGAFSLENDVIPSQSQQSVQLQEAREDRVPIMIPYTFKIRNPKGGYSTINSGLLAGSIRDSVSHHSITQPSKLQAPAGFLQQQQQQYGAPFQGASGYSTLPYGNSNLGGGGGAYGAPPSLNSHSSGGRGQSDYGDSVKYVDKSPPPVEIVDTQPAGGDGGYGSSGSGGSGLLSQQAEELKQKLKQMVLEELAAQLRKGQQSQGSYGPPPSQSQQYGPPPSQSQQYGPPPPSSSLSSAYGPPGEDSPSSIEFSGAFDNYDHTDSYDQSKYISPPSGGGGAHGHEYGPQKPIIDLDFEVGHTKGVHDHGSHGDYGVSILEANPAEDGHEPGTKQAIVKLGKNLFWSALDFSRKYNPITFYEKVKQFPPIHFEVYDDHKGHGGKGKKKKRSD